MLNRAQIIAENFATRVKAKQLPPLQSEIKHIAKEALISMFASQILSRLLDLKSRELKEQNLSFYTIGSSGHEGNAAIAHAFSVHDPAFLHYRSGAFMIERLKQLGDVDIAYDLMLSFLAAKSDPASGGRHKVFGSLAANVPPQTSTIASHCPKAVGCAFSLTLGKGLNIKTKFNNNSVVLCSFGDGSLNHSVTQGALNTASWIQYASIPLPLVFICEDNGIAISVPTAKNWVRDTVSHRTNIHYIACDGLNLTDTYHASLLAAKIARQKKQSVFLHMKCVRLMGHAGSDVEQLYLSEKTIEQQEFNDPLLHSANILMECGYLNADEIIELYNAIAKEVDDASAKAIKAPTLKTAKDVMASIIPDQNPHYQKNIINEQLREKTFGREFANLSKPRNMSQLINYALTDLMLQFDNIVLFGEDVAAKGGVYHVTAGLVKRFGQRRVFNSLLDETSILGQAIGLSLNGFLPIPEIQFLAYYHNAEDQIRGEAATLSFFSNKQFTNPMVVRIAGLGYQKGFGGHFHNDNSIAALRDLPGVIVACPSNGLNAVKLLREAIYLAAKENRVVIFLEPIALYMTKDCHEAGDQLWLHAYPPENEKIKFGEVDVYGESNSLAIVTYGNGYYLSRQAEKILRDEYQLNIKIIDLCWLSPLPKEALLNAIKDCQHVLIVDECRQTGSISEELITLFVESLPRLPAIKRLTGKDSYIPTGNSWQTVLPSRDDIIQHVVNMLGVTQSTRVKEI